MGCCNVRRFISIVMLRFLVTLGTWQCLWLHRTVMSFICFVQKGRAGSCWSLRTIFLCNTPSFTYNFVTHNSSHTTSFTSRSSTTSFIFPSFPVPATTFVAHYWKKLTCGVITSGPLVFVFRHLIHVIPPRWRIGLGQSGQGLIQVYGFHDFPKKRPQQLQGGDGGDRRALDNYAPATRTRFEIQQWVKVEFVYSLGHRFKIPLFFPFRQFLTEKGPIWMCSPCSPPVAVAFSQHFGHFNNHLLDHLHETK